METVVFGQTMDCSRVYRAPETTVLNLFIEEVLCGSGEGEFDLPSFGYDDDYLG